MISLLVLICFLLKDSASLIQLLDRKIDLLVQLVPAFILGLHYKNLKGEAVLVGLFVGVTVSLLLAFGGFNFVESGKIYGMHAGLLGLIPNTMLALLGSFVLRNQDI